ncbi:MAG: hypothetical protein PHX61_05910 [Alphaproteobacteria bacterium]|nr:hypothetical protein [Alphaproteobacteria bacterium]
MAITMTRFEKQRGSALFLILIGIALFAALSYGVSQGLRVSEGTMTGVAQDKARLEMVAVLDFVHGVQNGFQEMKLNGIEPAAVSFEKPTDVTYGTAPYDLKIFHPLGGKVIFVPVWPSLDDPAESTTTEWEFLFNTVDNVGGSGPELLMTLIAVPKPLCEALNKELTGSTVIPSAGDILGMFQHGTDQIDSGNCADCAGKRALCVENGGLRGFYFVLDRG